MFDMTKEKENKIALRVDFLKQMNKYVLEHIYDESAHMGWLMVAIPDAPTEDDFLDIAEDDEEWADICDYFGKLVMGYESKRMV